MRFLAWAILLAVAAPAEGAIPSRAIGPNVHGRVLFYTRGETLPLAGGTIRLLALQVRNGFALASTPPLGTFSDSRGFYSFFDVPSGVFFLEVSRKGVSGSREVGGGSTVRVDPGGIGVPDLAISWTDPCRMYYGRGFAPDYIRTKINVPWRASSKDWLEWAQRAGWRKGTAPAAGATAVFRATTDLPYGHLAWVDSVSADQREFIVSQWNEPGHAGPRRTCSMSANFGRLTHTRLKSGDPALLGFIYPRT